VGLQQFDATLRGRLNESAAALGNGGQHEAKPARVMRARRISALPCGYFVAVNEPIVKVAGAG
jgi:hypothetical protein